MARKSSRLGSRSIALGGILGAGSIVLLYFAGVVPSGRLGFAAAAGLFPMVGVLAAGRFTGILCWAVSGLVGLILLPDKGITILYLLFLGLYPVVKSWIEFLRKLPLEWALKLVYFNLCLTIVWFLGNSLLLPSLPLWLSQNILLVYLAGNVVFVIYDIGLSRLIALLQTRLGPGFRRP